MAGTTMRAVHSVEEEDVVRGDDVGRRPKLGAGGNDVSDAPAAVADVTHRYGSFVR